MPSIRQPVGLLLLELAARAPHLFDRPVGRVRKVEIGGEAGGDEADRRPGDRVRPVKAERLGRRQSGRLDRVHRAEAQFAHRTAHGDLQQQSGAGDGAVGDQARMPADHDDGALFATVATRALARSPLTGAHNVDNACAAASVALAIEECAGVDAKIKWVNDVFCHGKKVCGILTEAALDLETGGLQYAIVGIGVNLFPPKGGFPPELPEAGAVFPTRPQGLEGRSQLAGSILNHFFSFYPHLKDKPFFADYRRRSLVLGQEITVLEGGQTRTAFALDLERDFSLRVRETDGTIHTLSSGEVRVRPAHG